MKKIVSIITPSYNRADLIGETAESIFAQTYPHWEWFIVDDGSTDNSWQLLQDFAAADSRVKILQRNRAPKGACACRNIAVENCIGDYVMFLDTDDVLAPYCLEQRVLQMQENDDCDFVIFPMMMFEKKLDDLNVIWNVDNEMNDLKRILIGDAVCQGTGPLWKKSSFKKVGMWREDLHLWQDAELHIRSMLWPIKYVKRLDLLPDVYLRISYTSLSRSAFYSLPKLNSRITVLSYTCQTMTEKGVLENYRQELRHMAVDIALGAIIGNQFSAADTVLNICRKFGLLTSIEARRIKRFQIIRRVKLAKIKAIDNYFYKKARLNQPEVKSFIAKIPFTVPALSTL